MERATSTDKALSGHLTAQLTALIEALERKSPRLHRARPRGFNMDTPHESLARVAHQVCCALRNLNDFDVRLGLQ